jgi:4-amino-4-deoxy-L-arabinose transferase-like glycosyltransferase
MIAMQKISLRLSSPLTHILILALLSLPYFIRLGSSSIWNASEAFYAETSREMLVSKDYLAPHFNFEPRTQKPPLTYWAILASYKLFGVNEFSVRFPGSIAAIAIILFSYGIARFLFNPRIALMTAAITATTARLLILARRLPIDILLMFFLLGTFFFLIRAIQTNSRCYWGLAYLFAGAGFLTKGPIAVLIPAAVYLIWVLWNKKFSIAGFHPFMGLSILAIVILPWYVLIYHEYGWTYIGSFFLKDNLGRYLSYSFGPSRSPLYYLSVFATDFFPWSFPAIGAFYLLWRNRQQWSPFKSLSFGLPLIWCLFIFLLFSVSKNKQEYYIAPMYPVAAVILAAVLDKCFSGTAGNISRKIPASNPVDTDSISLPDPGSYAVWKYIYLFLSFLLAAFSILVFFILHLFMPHLSPVLHYVPSVVVAGTAIFAAGCVIGKKISRCFPAIAASMWIMFMLGVINYSPALEAYRPVKSFCKKIEAIANTDFQAGYYGVTVPSMVFYLHKQIFQEYNAASMVGRFRSDDLVFCILTAKDYAIFTEDYGLHLPVLDRGRRFSVKFKTILNGGYIPDEGLVLISNRPVLQPAPKMPVPYNEN